MPGRVLAALALAIAAATGLPGGAWAQAGAGDAKAGGSPGACGASWPAASAGALQRCEAHAGCRAVMRLMDGRCEAQGAFAGRLAEAQRAGPIADAALLRVLAESGVPATGLASCTAAFNRALCSQFLRVDDSIGPARPLAEPLAAAGAAVPATGAPVTAPAPATPDVPAAPSAPAGAAPAAAPPAAVPAVATAAPAAGGTPANRPPAPPQRGGVGPESAPSLCMRNAAKIEQTITRVDLRFFGVEHDLVTMEMARLGARLMEPCVAWDGEARAEYERRWKQAEVTRRYCAGEVPVDHCTPWGQREAENRRYFERWRTEATRALADAQFSADLGPARLPPPPVTVAAAAPALVASAPGTGASAPAVGSAGSAASVGPGAPVAAVTSVSGVAAASASRPTPVTTSLTLARYGTSCKPALQAMETEFEAIDRRRPPNAELLATLQTNLFTLGEQLALLESLCQGQPEYGYHALIKERLERARLACRGAAVDAARECVPRVAW